jgi:hypothetical protein
MTGREPPGVVVNRIRELLPDAELIVRKGLHTYAEGAYVGPVLVLWTEGREDVCVDISGSACEELGSDLIRTFMAWEGWKATRVDLALDGVPFTPVQVRDAWRAGNVRTRVKVSPDAIEGRDWRRCEWSEHVTGDLFGMGSRASRQYARCYNRRGPTRFELELKAEKAEVAVVELRGMTWGGTAFARFVVGAVRGFVEFIDRAANEKSERCPLLSWWAAFVDGVDRIRLLIPAKTTRTVGQLRDWIERQVGPSLAVVSVVLGDAAVQSMALDGSKRWSARHRAMIAAGGV